MTAIASIQQTTLRYASHNEVLAWIQSHRQALSGVVHNTNLLSIGGVFFDVVGCEAHCKEAISRGASLIITPLIHHDWSPSDRAVFHVEDPRLLFSKACALFYPKQPDVCIGVTGTNGKTSTVDFIRQLWSYQDKPAVSLGTLGLNASQHAEHVYDMSDLRSLLPTHLNTLDAYHMHRCLDTLVTSIPGVCVAFEASSHGLHQHRIASVRVSVAVFTNLSQDHLDYHDTMEQYFQSKARLFQDLLKKEGVAVINGDDPYGRRLIDMLPSSTRIITYSTQDPKATLYACIDTAHGKGMTLTVSYQNRDTLSLDVGIVGRFQVSNILAAVGAVLASDASLSLHDVGSGLSFLQSPKGRMEHVATTPAGADVFVDYAHTPDALQRALETLRYHTSGDVYVVCGCGGDRDRTKRPIMGRIAAEYADVVIITEDNPRTENADLIREAVYEGASAVLQNTDHLFSIAGRDKAIAHALSMAGAHDIVLIAGKGHEDYQIIGTTYHDFCDATVVRSLI